MTITAKIFGNLQTGVSRADDLRVRTPINAALQWLGEGLVDELNTHFGAVSTSISAALATFLATANTFTAAQTINVAAAGTAMTLVSTDGGAGGGPRLSLLRESATPAVNDEIGGLIMSGRNSVAGTISYARFRAVILDPSNGTEDGELQFLAIVGGAEAAVMRYSNGVQIGSPTGGYQGAGTLNMDNAIFRDGTQVVGARVTGYGDPFGAVSRATISVTTVTTAALASFVAAMYADLKSHGLIGN
jgi:hypothetical protein